jgi:autotransporter-associated beta strand protein
VPSSIGVGTSFNFGGTLRHVGAADSTSNRAFGLVGAAPVLDSSGTGTLSLTSGTTAAFTLGAGTTVAPFLTGDTVLTANDVWTLIPGLTIAGTGISPGTKITAINYDARQITLDTATTADSANSSLVTISGTGDLDRTLTLTGSNTGDNRLAAPLVNPAGTGVLGLVKSGAGKWILSGNSSYAGPTSVSAGTLLVNGSHSGAGACTVAAGATLGGSGSLAAAVNVTGTLAPGAGIGTLATGPLTFAANSTLAVEIDSATLGSDALVVTGDVVTGGNAVNLAVTDLGGNVPVANGTKLVLVDYSGIWADTDVVRFNGVPVPNGSNIVLGANTFTVNYSDDSLDGSAMTLTSANAATPFQTWINGFSGELPSAADRLPGADPDQDGRDNLLEFALNGDPADVADAGKMVFSTADSGDAGSAPDLSVTLAVRNGAVAGAGPGGSVTLAVDGIVYTLQGSETLAVFNKAVNEVTPASTLTPAPSAGWTTRTFQVSDSNTLPGKRFIRLSVSQ